MINITNLNKSFKSDAPTSLKNAEMDLTLKGLPIVLLDELSGKSNLLVDALGKSVDAQAHFTYQETPIVTLNLSSDVIKMDTLQFNLSPRITLMQPAKIQYQLPSSLINNLALKNSSLKLQGTTPTLTTLKKIDLSRAVFGAEPLKALSDAVIDADLNIQQLNVVGLTERDRFQIAQISLNISGPSLANSLGTVKATIVPSQENTILQQLLGPEIALQFQSAVALNPNGTFKIDEFKGEIKSAMAQAKLTGRLESLDKLFLTSPATIDYNLSPAGIEALGLNTLKLDNPSQIHAVVNADKKAINLTDLSSLQLNGLIKIDQINLYGNAGALQDLSLPWEINALNNSIALQFNGLTKLYSGRLQGSLEGFLHISQWIEKNKMSLAHAQFDSQLKLVNFPVAFIEKISGQEDLISLIGSAINIDFSSKLINQDQQAGSVQVAFKGQDLNGQGSFNIENGFLVKNPKSPASLTLTLSADRFQAFRKRLLTQNKKQPEIMLTSPAQIKWNVNSLSIPMQTSNTPNWLKASIASNISVDTLNIKDNSGRQVSLEDIEATLDSPELARNISFALNGKHNQAGSAPLAFSLNGRADNSFKPNGQLNTDNLALLLDSKFQQFPVKLLGQFFSVDDAINQKISVVFGDTVNADVHVQIDHLQGPVVASLSGSNGSISLDAYVNKGILTLKKDFQTQVALTKEFGEVILEDILPLAKGLIGSDNPLTINVAAKGFSLPIKNFDISAVQIGSATLELGKVRFKKDGQLGTILSLFNTSRSDIISVWFTPLYLSMQNGVITSKRMDMLIMDTYPIATWGNVNLAADRVNMIIGITGQALVKGFNIQGLGKDYILQIPFKGTISNAAIDKKKATAKIAALVASNRGPEGLLIGTALHIASGGLSEEKAPPPTTQPLPWSTGDDAESTPSSHPSSNHPLHEMEDKATSILRNIIQF